MAGPTHPEDNQSYFYDFVEILEKNFPYASYALVVEEIAFARDVGPIAAGLRWNDDGFYEMIVPIGYGRKAVIELEPDEHGSLQPAMGRFLKD